MDIASPTLYEYCRRVKQGDLVLHNGDFLNFVCKFSVFFTGDIEGQDRICIKDDMHVSFKCLSDITIFAKISNPVYQLLYILYFLYIAFCMCLKPVIRTVCCIWIKAESFCGIAGVAPFTR